MEQEYLVSHGKSGALGRFAAALACHRGDRVVVRGPHGLELGTVLCPATERQRRLLAATPRGELLRRAEADDERLANQWREQAGRLVTMAAALAAELALPLAILDAEVLLDGRQAILQCLATEEIDARPLLTQLESQFNFIVLLENLATPPPAEEHGGCGKPDCGKSAGGCTDCGSGGGCSSCGSGKVDMRDYFGHLRTKMEEHQRTPLL